MPLTEQALAIHNSIILQYPIPVEEEEEYLEQSLFDKVNERCNDIQQDFEEKIKVKCSKYYMERLLYIFLSISN
jgi:hypothetical protein